jgi:hypothetical protein
MSSYPKISTGTRTFPLQSILSVAVMSVAALLSTECGSGWANVTPVSSSSNTKSGFAATLTTSDPSPALGTQSNVSWETTSASIVQVQGDDLATSTANGTHSLAATQNATYYLAAASDTGEIVNQSLTIQVDLTEAQQQAAHAQWLAGVQTAAAAMGCTGPVTVQQTGELAAALVAQAVATNSSCIVLQPTSTSGSTSYVAGLALYTSSNNILYISDNSTSDIFNPAISF